MRHVRGIGWAAQVVRGLTGSPIVYSRRGPRVPRAVALTFDDGPGDWTAPILDVLAGTGARATFFVLGCAIEGREPLVRRIVADGHELGNHAYSHRDLSTLTDEEITAELERTGDLLEEVAALRPRLFRPPYADSDPRVARVAARAGLSPTVLRSVDPADWRTTDHEAIAHAVLERIHPGAIVCLHDALPPQPQEPVGAPHRAATVEALALILAGLEAVGLDALTVGELLA